MDWTFEVEVNMNNIDELPKCVKPTPGELTDNFKKKKKKKKLMPSQPWW